RVADFRSLLSGSLCKANIDSIVKSVDSYPEDFDTIYQLMNDPEIKVSWRAAWACEKIAEIRPSLFVGKEEELINKLIASNHDGTKRLLLSIIYDLPVPEPLPVNLLDYCFSHMYAPDESVGVQSLCIKMAYMLCRKEPDLLHELKLYMENTELEYYSTAIKTCTRNILKKLH
ncbi:hypothetical protein LJC29_05695, partial [Bacteroides sp. OttesenSCG-928-N06]|nr:hypothetical protein [Bacteroides sp. OttesenSCG-928-N06]